MVHQVGTLEERATVKHSVLQHWGSPGWSENWSASGFPPTATRSPDVNFYLVSSTSIELQGMSIDVREMQAIHSWIAAEFLLWHKLAAELS